MKTSARGSAPPSACREGNAIHHWDAKQRLEWVKRDTSAFKANNLLDAAGYVAGALITGVMDDDGDFAGLR